MTKPVFILVAGVNGAGKSTLYSVYPAFFEGSIRLNADEILRDFGGDWRVTSDNAKAMRMEVNMIKQYFQEKTSFHMETTLAGNAHSHLKRINKAKELGYHTIMHYIRLDSAEEAISRVHDRVNKGGHGVESEVIRKRYESSLSNFEVLKDKVDEVFIWENKDKEGFELVNQF
ncbi:zeta toxin family protein [Streptococcus pluranimalium]|uniref:zeta toxin family protein n=2 Tax=Streptococcus pluranimalium TaxID=82348 RepID=UPI003F67A7D5